MNLGHGDRDGDRRAAADQLRPRRLVHATTVHDATRSSSTRPSSHRSCRSTTRAIYPVSGGSEAIETACKLARSYHLARGERRPARRARSARLVPRQQPRRARSLGPGPARARRTSRGSASPSTSRPLYPYRVELSGAEHAARLDETIDQLGADARRRVRRGADRGRGHSARRCRRTTTGRAVADVCRRARRAAHRGRGDDRLRAHRRVVRLLALGRPTRHAGRGQGRVEWLLAARARRSRADRCTTPCRPAAGSSTASPGPIIPAARPSGARCCSAWCDDDLVAAEPRARRPAARAAPGRARGRRASSATCAAAGLLIGRRARRGPGDEGRVPARRRASPSA